MLYQGEELQNCGCRTAEASSVSLLPEFKGMRRKKKSELK
jgi:hypothetical protein